MGVEDLNGVHGLSTPDKKAIPGAVRRLLVNSIHQLVTQIREVEMLRQERD